MRKFEIEEDEYRCNQKYKVIGVTCFSADSRQAVIKIDNSNGNHTLYPGDYITFDKLDTTNTNAAQRELILRQLNGQHRVFGLAAPLATDTKYLRWHDQSIWSNLTQVGNARGDEFAVTFDTPGLACDASVTSDSIVRRSANTHLPFCS